MTIFDQLQRIDQHRTQAHAEGLPALNRLADAARQDSGQARTIGLFLLGLYNGTDYPFNLSRLRGLDMGLHVDCLAVLRLDYHPAKEVHQHIEGGDDLFRKLRARASEGLANRDTAAANSRTVMARAMINNEHEASREVTS